MYQANTTGGYIIQSQTLLETNHSPVLLVRKQIQRKAKQWDQVTGNDTARIQA